MHLEGSIEPELIVGVGMGGAELGNPPSCSTPACGSR